MTDLRPNEELTVVRSPEARGDPTIYTYRGARITAWKFITKLTMAGHPLDANNFGNLPHTLTLVDWWLDQGKLPAPYVWPTARCKGTLAR